MDQEEFTDFKQLEDLLNRYTTAYKKPTKQLQQLVRNINPSVESLHQLLIMVKTTFIMQIHVKKIYYLLKLLIQTTKHWNIFKADLNLRKAYANYIFALFPNLENITQMKRLAALKPLFCINSVLEIINLDNSKILLGVVCFGKDPTIREIVKAKLRDQFLVDLKSKQPNAFTFHKLLFTSGLLDNADIIETIQAAERLLKRSESNIETLLTILEALQQTNVDLSQHIADLHACLNEFLISNNSARSLKALTLAYSLIRQEDVIILSIRFVSKLMSTTHDDPKKFAFLVIAQGLAKAVSQSKDLTTAGQELLSLLVVNASIIQNENQLIEMYTIANILIEAGVPLPDKEGPNYKKLLQANKFTSSFISLIFLSWIKIKKETVLEEAWFHEVAEAIFTYGVSLNLKNFAKIVTQTIMFLAALNFTCLYLYYCEEEADSKFITSVHKLLASQTQVIFNSQSHLTKLNYLINPSGGKLESQMIADSLLLLYAIYFDEFSEKVNFDYFATLFTLISFGNTKVKNSIKFKMSLIEKKLETYENGVQIFIQQVFHALYVFLYNISNQSDNVVYRKNRLNSFIATLFTEPAIRIAQNMDQIVYTLCHPHLSKKLLQKFTTFEIDFESNVDENIRNVLFFFTELQKISPYSHDSILNYTKFLIDMGIVDQLVERVSLILDPANLKNVLSLDNFEDELRQFQKNYKLDIVWKTTFAGMGVDPIKEYHIEELEQIVAVPKGKKQQVLMDENEAQKHMTKKHRIRTLHFYQLIMEWLRGFATTKNHDFKEWFFFNYFEQLSNFCSDRDFRLPYFKLASSFFEQYDITRSFKYTLAEFQIFKASKEVHQNLIPKYGQFQARLVEKYSQQEIDSKAIVSVIHYGFLFVLQQNEFELKNKELGMRFALQYAKLSQKFCEKHLIDYYEPLVENINICAHVGLSFDFLKLLLQFNEEKEKQYLRIFRNILNLAEEAQQLSLKCLSLVDPTELPLDVGFYLKLYIISVDSNDKLAKAILAKLPDFSNYIPFIKDWNYGEFVENHAREHVEIMIQFLKEKVPKDSAAWVVISDDNYETAKTFDGAEEQLRFYPYFLSMCVEFLPEDSVPQMIDLILSKFADDVHLKDLMETSTQSGIVVIKYWGKKLSKSILAVIEKYMKASKQSEQASSPNSICAIVFLGILSPFLVGENAQIQDIQNKILTLFKISSRKTQSSLAKNLPDLLSFFPQAMAIVEQTYLANKQESNQQCIRGNAFLIAGLVRAMGINSLEETKILSRLEEGAGEKKETQDSKVQVLLMIEAIVDIMGRTIEPFILQIMGILMKYYGDGKEEIRDIAINATKIVMQKLSGYGVKTILPELLKGMEESKSWRGKIASIWALGNMAYCAPKQLSSRLPLIVSSISKAISDTHPQVRKSANESLELIGSTIQNPEISHIADILIRALSNPFDENLKGLEAILSTSFRHYIDAPALSLLIPIIDYALRSLDNEQKSQSCNLIGNLSALIKNKDDLVPYMEMIVGGLEVAIGDALVEIRSLAARAIGRLSNKIGIQSSESYFKFVQDILCRSDINAIKRAGAANAFAEMICSQGEDYYNQQMLKIYENIARPEIHLKEGYIGVFMSLPMIWREKFQESVEEVVNNISEFISHEEDSVRNITLRVLKIVIKNYGCEENELLYQTLNDNMMNVFWKRRNGAVILTGEMLSVTQDNIKEQNENPQAKQIINLNMYNQNLMLLYTLRQDEAEQVRQNATQIWKQFIDNTPRCVKRALKYLVIGIASIIGHLQTVGINTIQNFCQKYGDSHLYQFLQHLQEILEDKSNLSMVQGAYRVLSSIYKYSDSDALLKFNDLVQHLSHMYTLSDEQHVKKALFDSVGEMMNKGGKSTKFLEEFIQPYLVSFAKMEENDPTYISHLDIFNHLCSLRIPSVLQYLVELLLEQPFQQFKIDVITNNASIFARVIYIKRDEEIPMQVLFEQLFVSISNYKIDHEKIEWSLRTQSLLYCIGQISIHLDEAALSLFLTDVIEKFDLYQKSILSLESNEQDVQFNFPYLLATFEALLYCLNNTSEDFHSYNQKIITRIIPFLFPINNYLRQDQSQELISLVTKLLICINNTQDKSKHHENLTQIHTSFTNRIRSKDSVIPGLTSIEPFVQMLIDAFLFGDYERYSQGCEFLELLLDKCKPDQSALIKIVGSLIRILSYKTTDKLKTLKILLKTQDHIQHFSVQLHVTYSKIASSITDRKVLQQLAQNYAKLMIIHPRRDLTLKELFFKGIQSDTLIQQENFLKITKSIIKSARTFELKSEQLLFSMALLERIFIHARQFYERALMDQQVSSYVFQQLSQILPLTYKQTSKQNQEKFRSQYLQQVTQESILIQLAFYRLLKYPENMREETLKLLNSCSDNQIIAQVVLVIQKKDVDLNIDRELLIKTIGSEKVQDSQAIQDAIK